MDRKIYLSEAFRSLGKNSIKVLIALLDKREREPNRKTRDKKGNKRKIQFTNLHRLVITYGELEKKFGLNRGRIPAAIDDLLAKGFITLAHHGGAYQRDKSVYALSENYLMWSKGMEPFSVRPKVEKRGYMGSKSEVSGKGQVSEKHENLNSTLKNEPLHAPKNEP